MDKISKKTAGHYLWGEGCDGWNLVSGQDLSVIHERMPAHTCEARHYHHKARQFFFILKGQALMQLEGRTVELSEQEGIEIPPLAVHQIMNVSDTPVEFLVISHPTTRGDRTEV